MKFTQISTLALAAMMAFSSCSKEEVTNPGEADLLPGEARIVLDLGRKGATTYGSLADETTIKNASGRLFNSVGAEIPATFALEGTKLVVTVAAADANAENVTLFAYVNGEGKVKDRVDETATAMENHAAATVETDISNLWLPAGFPAGLKVEGIKLTPGMITNTNAPEAPKRAGARISVRSGNGVSIKDYKVEFFETSTMYGVLYAGLKNEGSNVDGTKSLLTRKVQYEGINHNPVFADGYEPMAYVYPTKKVVVTVTSTGADAVSKTVEFAPLANTTYCIKISPNDGKVGFDMAIGGWQGVDGERV